MVQMMEILEKAKNELIELLREEWRDDIIPVPFEEYWSPEIRMILEAKDFGTLMWIMNNLEFDDSEKLEFLVHRVLDKE